jgi:hypothetical protein
MSKDIVWIGESLGERNTQTLHCFFRNNFFLLHHYHQVVSQVKSIKTQVGRKTTGDITAAFFIPPAIPSVRQQQQPRRGNLR